MPQRSARGRCPEGLAHVHSSIGAAWQVFVAMPCLLFVCVCGACHGYSMAWHATCLLALRLSGELSLVC